MNAQFNESPCHLCIDLLYYYHQMDCGFVNTSVKTCTHKSLGQISLVTAAASQSRLPPGAAGRHRALQVMIYAKFVFNTRATSALKVPIEFVWFIERLFRVNITLPQAWGRRKYPVWTSACLLLFWWVFGVKNLAAQSSIRFSSHSVFCILVNPAFGRRTRLLSVNEEFFCFDKKFVKNC